MLPHRHRLPEVDISWLREEDGVSRLLQQTGTESIDMRLLERWEREHWRIFHIWNFFFFFFLLRRTFSWFLKFSPWRYRCVFSSDPHQRSRYLKANSFLTLLDGDRPHRNLKGNAVNPFQSQRVVGSLDRCELCFVISPPQRGGKASYTLRSSSWLEDQTMASSHRGSPGWVFSILSALKFEMPPPAAECSSILCMSFVSSHDGNKTVITRVKWRNRWRIIFLIQPKPSDE